MTTTKNDPTLLDQLAEAFLATLSDNDDDKEEEWASPRGHHETGVYGFVYYLEHESGAKVVAHLTKLQDECSAGIQSEKSHTSAASFNREVNVFIDYIAKKLNVKKEPCGECHLRANERCDICGAKRNN